MKRYFALTLILLIFFFSQSKSQSRWIEDSQMNFKIQVPSNYQANQFWEGSDKIHAFLSPDQNVAVRVRTFNVNNNTSLTQVVQLFSRDIIKGAAQLVSQPHTLNGMDGNLSGYKWTYNNISVIVAAFTTIQEGRAYVVWTLIPENLFATRNSESDAITNTFTVSRNLTASNPPVSNPPVSPPTTSTTPPPSNTPPLSGYNFITYVSGDAYIEYKIPSNAVMKSAESGLSTRSMTLKNGTTATIVIQNVFKQSQFSDFASEQISSIRGRGATITSQSHETINNLDVFRYEYELNNTTFVYTAIDGPVSYFLIGYVGNTAIRNELRQLHNQTHNSFRQSATPPSASAANTSTNRSTSTTKNTSYGNSSHNNSASYGSNALSPPKNIKPLINEGYPLKINTLNVGPSITNSLAINTPTEHLQPSQKTIHLVAEHNGKDNGHNFLVKWYSVTQECLVAEQEYKPRTNGLAKVHSFVNIKNGNWPQGQYRAEIWHMGHKMAEKIFTIGSSPHTQQATNNTQWAKASGTAKVSQTTPPKNNNTKQSGGIKQIVLDNKTYGYDFTTGKLRTDYEPEPDVMNRPWCTPLPALTGNWVRTGKSKMEDVTSAPPSGYLSDGKGFIDCAEAPLNEVLVFKLNNGKYAKLMIINDQQTKTSSGCEHKITCLVEYPAF
jgi:hypothetical protein